MNPPAAKTSLTDYGETVTTTVAHTPANGGYDCLTWAAMIFSTAVADRDHDGVPDGIEDSTQDLKDPPTSDSRGTAAAESACDGAGTIGELRRPRRLHRDQRDADERGQVPRGAERAVPRRHGAGVLQIRAGAHAHAHARSAGADRRRIQAKGIRAHFDVGDITAYQTVRRSCIPTSGRTSTTTPSPTTIWFHRRAGRGGCRRARVRCFECHCQFPAYPGTVSWKVGLQLYRDSPVNDATGAEFQVNHRASLWCRRIGRGADASIAADTGCSITSSTGTIAGSLAPTFRV